MSTSVVSPSQGSREDDGEELVSEFHRQNEKIKTLRKQLLDAKDELRYIIYTLLPTLNFRNVPVHEEFQLKTPISPTGTTTSTTSTPSSSSSSSSSSGSSSNGGYSY